MLQKGPADSIKSFKKVDFDGAPGKDMLPPIMFKNLLTNKNVVLDRATRHKSTLSAVNNRRESQAYTVSNNLGNHFVEGVATRDGPKVADTRWVGNLRDKRDASVVDLLEESPIIKEVKRGLDDIGAKDAPYFFKEQGVGMYPSGPGALQSPMEWRAFLISLLVTLATNERPIS